jgi:RimJ/RimL family protein N-acetyltransferase
MTPNLQPVLENEQIILSPLEATDVEVLYSAASNPKVWEQHPNKDRWKREVFLNFFEGALQSKGAFKVILKATGKVVGSSRFYDYNEQDNSITIGYTFYETECWGKGINSMVKAMMLNYIFQFTGKVYFFIGADNLRSQIAIQRVGAKKVGEEEVAYFGEAPKPNFIYAIEKTDWQVQQN